MGSPEFDVLAVGDLNVDLVLLGCPWPEAGKERIAASSSYTLGGSGGIFACNLAALGARVALAARIGADAPGRFLLEELGAAGVDVSGVRVSPELKTGISVVLALSGQEQKALLTHRGAMERLSEGDVPDELLRRARHLHVTSYYMLPALRGGCARLLARARAAGLSTSLDTNDDPDECWDGDLPEVLRHTDIFFPNRREALSIAGRLAGQPGSGGGDRPADLGRAAKRLTGYWRMAAVKADLDGALLVAEGGRTRLQVPALPVQFVEATGAGDSFDAGFLIRYLGGAPLDDCLRFANACGALAVSAAGGTAAFREPGARERLSKLAASAQV